MPTPCATALSGLEVPRIRPIDQLTARFVNQVAHDPDFEDVAISFAQGDRLAAMLGDKPIQTVGSYGVSA